jgi:thioredoxin 1
MGVHNIAEYVATARPVESRVSNVRSLKAYKSDIIEADASTLVVLDCFAVWCGPCKTIAPTIAKYSEEYPTAKFFKVDVDEASDVAQELGIRAMPTFLFFKNGEKVGEVVGANARQIEATIKQHL